MSVGRLSSLQVDVLAALAPIVPPWTLTGGAALAAFYTRHRTTRDLDLFWHGRDRLEELPALVTDRLQAAGFAVMTVQTAPAFVRISVARGDEMVLVDLVAEPVAVVEPPVSLAITPTALPFNELRSYAGYPTRRRKSPRPRLLLIDRLVWPGLRRGWPRWEEARPVDPAARQRWRLPLSNHREVIALPRLGGLHHRYGWRRAA